MYASNFYFTEFVAIFVVVAFRFFSSFQNVHVSKHVSRCICMWSECSFAHFSCFLLLLLRLIWSRKKQSKKKETKKFWMFLSIHTKKRVFFDIIVKPLKLFNLPLTCYIYWPIKCRFVANLWFCFSELELVHIT